MPKKSETNYLPQKKVDYAHRSILSLDSVLVPRLRLERQIERRIMFGLKTDVRSKTSLRLGNFRSLDRYSDLTPKILFTVCASTFSRTELLAYGTEPCYIDTPKKSSFCQKYGTVR